MSYSANSQHGLQRGLVGDDMIGKNDKASLYDNPNLGIIVPPSNREA